MIEVGRGPHRLFHGLAALSGHHKTRPRITFEVAITICRSSLTGLNQALREFRGPARLHRTASPGMESW
jgi:hypothetical protein